MESKKQSQKRTAAILQMKHGTVAAATSKEDITTLNNNQTSPNVADLATPDFPPSPRTTK